jgi:hypothetical protein
VALWSWARTRYEIGADRPPSGESSAPLGALEICCGNEGSSSEGKDVICRFGALETCRERRISSEGKNEICNSGALETCAGIGES